MREGKFVTLPHRRTDDRSASSPTTPKKEPFREHLGWLKKTLEWQKALKQSEIPFDGITRSKSEDKATEKVVSDSMRSAKVKRRFSGVVDKQFQFSVDYDFIKHRVPIIQNKAGAVNVRPTELPLEEVTEFVFANGDEYEGEFYMDPDRGPQRCGLGKYTKPNGTVLLGDWFEDALHGDSCFVSMPTEKVIYKGGMNRGVPHGFGTYRGPAGYYEGYFCDGKLSGRGLFINPEGFCFRGEFRGSLAPNLELYLENTVDEDISAPSLYPSATSPKATPSPV